MPRYRISTSETIYTFYEIDIPADCPDPTQYFYDNEDCATRLDSDSDGWVVDDIEEIKNDK